MFLVIAVGALLIAAPAQAFAHDRVVNPYLHALLDGVTLATVALPLLSTRLWERGRRGLLLCVVALVQAPVAVIGFVPVVHPALHLIAFVVAVALTAAARWYVRTASPAPVAVPAKAPD
jgi:heme/copper-type cytochrome/quinol oxidase subunit 4